MNTLTEEVDILETVEFDDEGFMEDSHAWVPEIAFEIADILGLELNDRHWVVINFARHHFKETEESPTLRQITKRTDVSMKEIYKLFPGGPAKVAAKIAGLKKPTGCI